MKLHLTILAATALAVTGCGGESSQPADKAAADEAMATSANPLLETWNTPFGVPPFDAIESEHYLPALRAAMAMHNEEIDAIVSSTAAPTFANTIEALEFAGEDLSRVDRVFNAVDNANSDDIIKETARIIAPELSAHYDNISLNKGLFDRVLAERLSGAAVIKSRLPGVLHAGFIQ